MPTVENIFENWRLQKMSDKTKIQQAELILKLAESLKNATPEEKKIIKEAEDFLLQRD